MLSVPNPETLSWGTMSTTRKSVSSLLRHQNSYLAGDSEVRLGPQKTRRVEPLPLALQTVVLHPRQHQLIALFHISDEPPQSSTARRNSVAARASSTAWHKTHEETVDIGEERRWARRRGW